MWSHPAIVFARLRPRPLYAILQLLSHFYSTPTYIIESTEMQLCTCIAIRGAGISSCGCSYPRKLKLHIFDDNCELCERQTIHSRYRKRTFLKEMGSERDGVGFPLGISSFPLIGFRFRPEGREWSRFIVDCGRLKGGQVSHIPLTRSCWLVKYLEIYTRVDKNRCPSISAFTRGFLYRTKLIYHTYTLTLSQDTLQP